MDALVVEGDGARSLARELAERQGTSVDEAVLTALRASLKSSAVSEPLAPQLSPPDMDPMTAEQRVRYESILELARSMAAKKPGATSRHDDLYVEFGLPK
ncbi:type II toxin-antitoxin system VapB family antitoxin [Methylobacterium sp. ARG-1]|uniref:type II toxin-antitoxin system VapB family antitoxin n=1 Tax=Methylobacterium sp. ARG-1 TaxID=1692501 RepID=UPI0011876DB9|nr:type II toxin-antitoxin system VapB family antitoxin [Methylobacterium sp. ARG-1]